MDVALVKNLPLCQGVEHLLQALACGAGLGGGEVETDGVHTLLVIEVDQFLDSEERRLHRDHAHDGLLVVRLDDLHSPF